MFEGLGDQIPVSLMPVDGTFPSGTATWEKRNIANAVPVWLRHLHKYGRILLYFQRKY
jgi:pyruvate-ferredoxin/flavodoxin oxidoreductase